MQAAADYHDHVLGPDGPVMAPGERSDAGPYPDTTPRSVAPPGSSAGWVAPAASVRIVQRARDLEDGDPQPRRAGAYLRLWQVATSRRYGAYIDGDDLWECSGCGRYCRVKLDGQLYAHPGCDVTARDALGLRRAPDVTHCVVLRGPGWVAWWESGRAVGAYDGKVGKVTLADLVSRVC